MMPFHEWKQEIINKEGGRIHPKDWYYTQYGRYCNEQRRLKQTAGDGNPHPTTTEKEP